MIRKTIDIDGYWKVIVYFNVNYNFFNVIANDLRALGCSRALIKDVYFNMSTGYAKAVTVSNPDNETSIVAYNKHKSYYDYINSIIHEAEHVKQAMLDYYNVDDEGEPPAYTIAYIAIQMLKVFADKVKIKNLTFR